MSVVPSPQPPADYVRFRLENRRAGQYEPFELLTDRADLPAQTLVPGSLREPLEAWVALDGDAFAVYLPPADPEWGKDWRPEAGGYVPNPEVALQTFDAWAKKFT